jgi:subtilisin family serine protease
VKGTSNETFQAFLLLPPLANRKGDLISFSDVPWQSYQVLDLSDADAAIIRANPLISFVEPIPRHVPSTLQKRSLPSALNVRKNSPYHLGLLTARNQRLNPSVLPDYVFEPSLGKGQTIYVIDSGYLPIHEDFDATEREVRDVTTPNRFTLDPLNIPFADQAPQDNTDFTGHGTAVASIAAGKLRGVASKANLVVVKFKNAALNPNKPDTIAPRGVLDGALEFALDFVISDIARSKRANNNDPNKKFIVNLSYGKQSWVHRTTSYQPQGNI